MRLGMPPPPSNIVFSRSCPFRMISSRSGGVAPPPRPDGGPLPQGPWPVGPPPPPCQPPPWLLHGMGCSFSVWGFEPQVLLRAYRERTAASPIARQACSGGERDVAGASAGMAIPLEGVQDRQPRRLL